MRRRPDSRREPSSEIKHWRAPLCDIQLKLNGGYEDLHKARADSLLVKRSILLKKQEMAALLMEELRVEETGPVAEEGGSL